MSKAKAASDQPESSDASWRAVVGRDASRDGDFFYSVITTGVFCKPSCASRQPRRENVAFYDTAAQAEAAGYRACKRCKPTHAEPVRRRAAEVAQLCRFIESSTEPVTTERLAAEIGASASHTHRLFKAVTGLTPRQYAAEYRRQQVRSLLPKSSSVSEALHAAGYGSPARFYEGAEAALGMTPSVYRSGGKGEVLRFAVAESSLGCVLVAATGRGICCILLGDEPQVLIEDLTDRFPQAELVGADPGFDQLVALVVGLVDHPSQDVALPLDIRGTAFQQRVWAALMQVPSGTTTTYSEIAERIGLPKAARAVAGACAANPLAVAVPCHRVKRRDGGISGYRWGVERKLKLLEREQS